MALLWQAPDDCVWFLWEVLSEKHLEVCRGENGSGVTNGCGKTLDVSDRAMTRRQITGDLGVRCVSWEANVSRLRAAGALKRRSNRCWTTVRRVALNWVG